MGRPASHVKNPALLSSLLSSASLTDKPLGASGRGAEVVEGGHVRACDGACVQHEVCQQVSGGTGLSANSRSTPTSQDAHRNTELC